MNYLHDLRKWPYKISTKDIVVELELDVIPRSKARPRFANGKVYSATGQKKYEQDIGWQLKAAYGMLPDSVHWFGVRIAFMRNNFQRLDLDNLVKSIFDAANQVIWKDDSQVTELHTYKQVSTKETGVNILVWRKEDRTLC